jgi:hypothetical protein
MAKGILSDSTSLFLLIIAAKSNSYVLASLLQILSIIAKKVMSMNTLIVKSLLPLPLPKGGNFSPLSHNGAKGYFCGNVALLMVALVSHSK